MEGDFHSSWGSTIIELNVGVEYTFGEVQLSDVGTEFIGKRLGGTLTNMLNKGGRTGITKNEVV